MALPPLYLVSIEIQLCLLSPSLVTTIPFSVSSGSLLESEVWPFKSLECEGAAGFLIWQRKLANNHRRFLWSVLLGLRGERLKVHHFPCIWLPCHLQRPTGSQAEGMSRKQGLRIAAMPGRAKISPHQTLSWGSRQCQERKGWQHVLKAQGSDSRSLSPDLKNYLSFLKSWDVKCS